MSKDKHFSDINVKIIKDEDNLFSLKAEPFERGYGVTVGNALRRTLMTSVPGAAIVSIKIDGIDHEFSSIDGILEDVSDIVLNLKKKAKDLKKRYGKDWKTVMYKIATSTAMGKTPDDRDK